MFDPYAPRLWADSSTETLLIPAHSHVQGIAAEFLHKFEGEFVPGIERIVHDQDTKTLGRSIKP